MDIRVIACLEHIAALERECGSDHPALCTNALPQCVCNIGDKKPVEFTTRAEALAFRLVRKTERNMLPMKPARIYGPRAVVVSTARKMPLWPGIHILMVKAA